MSFDDYDFADDGYDYNYDASDDIYAGTAACDDGCELDGAEPAGGDLDACEDGVEEEGECDDGRPDEDYERFDGCE
jgi:hypothetical protein